MNGLTRAFGRVWAIALNTFREAVRNKVLYVLVMFAVGLMAFSLVLGELSMHEEVRIIKDLGLAGIDFMGLVIALFLGVNLLAKELERKTVYAVIPKPLYRHEFLLGKYLGLAITLLVLVALMSAILAALVSMQGGRHGVTMIRAEVLVLLELLLVTAVALVFSSFSSPYLSGMFTAGVWIIGRNTAELQTFAETKLEATPVGTALELLIRIMPDFRMFYVSGASLAGPGETSAIVTIHETFVSWPYVAQAALYSVSYTTVCMLAAMMLFAKRDFT